MVSPHALHLKLGAVAFAFGGVHDQYSSSVSSLAHASDRSQPARNAHTTIQVANYANVATAVREKPRECERQQLTAGTDFGATFVRLRGGEFRVVLTPEQWFALWREATA